MRVLGGFNELLLEQIEQAKYFQRLNLYFASTVVLPLHLYLKHFLWGFLGFPGIKFNSS